MSKKVLLVILDGWGLPADEEKHVSAIHLAKTPFVDSLYKNYPNSKLHADGLHVGLPEGQMGNSEVGHMTIGAGRTIDQDLVKINKSIQTKQLSQNKDLQEALEYAQENNKSVHFLGLLSDGGIHSHINHLKGLLDVATEYELPNQFIHAFTDGRDTDPKSSPSFILDLQNHIDKTNSSAQLASVVGRYYAMDRDKRWPRIKKAYDLITKPQSNQTSNPIQSIQQQYQNNITDEFLESISVKTTNTSKQHIQTQDVVIFFNYRTDRCRQIVEVLTQQDHPEENMQIIPMHCLTMTKYDPDFINVKPIFTKEKVENTLGEVISKAGLTQVRIAETEKNPHVTYFFNCGKEDPFPGERKTICQSPKVATYDLQPEMSAACITESTLKELIQGQPDFICVNFANADMVGHTGSLDAAIKACETIDQDLQKIVEEAQKQNYSVIITADHGNCEKMKNPDGSPHTAHTTNLVPCILIDPDYKQIQDGSLANLAPTILKLLSQKIPLSMKESLL